MTASEIAELIGAESPGSQGDDGRELLRVAAFPDATPEAIVFATDAAALLSAVQSHAGLILAPLNSAADDERIVPVADPKYAFAQCARALALPPEGEAMHPSAVFHPSAVVGRGSRVGAGAVIEANVHVGVDCMIGSRVTLCQGVELGDRVVVQPGAVLGSTGFGYVRDRQTGEYLLFPQQGRLVIENDVEIGANTTIDRGALGETRIGQGTKIDNQVHIGHNCAVGKNVVIAAQVGISGSCVIGDGAVLAGQAGLGDHVTLCEGVILGGAAGVFPHKRLEGKGQMFMGVPAEPLHDYLKTIARVRRLK